MLLVTTTRIVNGYRILAAVSCCAPVYQWRLYRNGAPLTLPVDSEGLDNVVSFDLKEPLAPGIYELWVAYVERVDEFIQPRTAVVTALVVAPGSCGKGDWA